MIAYIWLYDDDTHDCLEFMMQRSLMFFVFGVEIFLVYSENWVQWMFFVCAVEIGWTLFCLVSVRVLLLHSAGLCLLCVVVQIKNIFPLQIKRRNGLIKSGLLIIIEIKHILVHIHQKLYR